MKPKLFYQLISKYGLESEIKPLDSFKDVIHRPTRMQTGSMTFEITDYEPVYVRTRRYRFTKEHSAYLFIYEEE